MKLIRFGEAGKEKPGLVLPDGRHVDASAFVSDYNEEFFGNGGIARLEAWIRTNAAVPAIDPSVRLGSPIARPSKIICIGMNYRDHAAETGAPVPLEPVLFFKSTTSLVGPNDAVVIPKGAGKLDWEVELAVIIGARSSYLSKEDAISHIAGYALHNDYSERTFQFDRGGQWVKGKSADTFAPFGPFLATRDEIPNPGNLPMWLKVNGEFHQKSTTANMVFDVPMLVSYTSQFMTLLPGDVISTGTPAGVGFGMKPPKYLQPGDSVELGIDGLGESRQRVVAWTPSGESTPD
ncbi:MAG TPA: fumarylacetoacetate hydrolase family protein [Candidatus Acidoferrum sp.]|nr:fumarylacetoacetate hydrolase family protein [Candidatus Acidoferrum sp.]